MFWVINLTDNIGQFGKELWTGLSIESAAPEEKVED